MLSISDEYKLNPEMLEFTDSYLSTLDLTETCRSLHITEEEGAEFLRKKEVKRFIDTAFIEQGYMNRFKIKDVLEKAIFSKLDEAEESGMYTKYDLLDILKMMHQMRLDEHKISQTGPTRQTNIQVNSHGANLENLLGKISK